MSLIERKRAALRLEQTPTGWNIDNGLVLSAKQGSGRYDEALGGRHLFWRGDRRGPEEVFETGFQCRAVRENTDPDDTDPCPYVGQVIWRCGDDDILHESAVTFARDIRGAVFFPFTAADDDDDFGFWLYAVAPRTATNTYRAQQIAEAVEVGTSTAGGGPPSGAWRKDKSRWAYDPGEFAHEDASCVWQFHEHANPSIPPEQIVGAWPVVRSMLVHIGTDSRERAGISFSTQPSRGVDGPMEDDERFREAAAIVKSYKAEYPNRSNHWLSFYGIVHCRPPADDFRDATDRAEQKEAIVVLHGKLNDRGGW